MLQRIIKGNTDNIKIISNLVTIVFICIITVSVLFCISALAVFKIDISYETLPAVIAAILAVSSAFDGFLVSKLLKENGLFWGVFVGLIIFAVLIIISLYYSTFNVTTNLLTRFAILVTAGAIGGVVGVNTN